MADPDPQPIADWLAEQALLAPTWQEIVGGCAERAMAAGVPLTRVLVAGATLHPEFDAISITWLPDGIKAARHPHGSMHAPGFVHSPIRQVLLCAEANLAEARRRNVQPPLVTSLRFRLEAGEGLDDFALLRELHAGGGTDYLVFSLRFCFDGRIDAGEENGVVTTWLTERPGGFTEGEVACLTRVQVPLAAAVRVPQYVDIARTLLSTYLGADAGTRVLDGAVQRGHVQSIQAAILIADLRGFTALSDDLPGATLVRILDDCLECMADPVVRHGGQVLKFLGDGLLATFDVAERAAADACADALQAALDIQAGIDRLNASEDGERPLLAVDVALHIGEVLYGNVGAPGRLDFTVIGPAVNEASRMETRCAALGEPLLVSQAFVQAAGPMASFRCAGEQRLRGLDQPRVLFAPVR